VLLTALRYSASTSKIGACLPNRMVAATYVKEAESRLPRSLRFPHGSESTRLLPYAARAGVPRGRRQE
jgi:hypothetical protein